MNELSKLNGIANVIRVGRNQRTLRVLIDSSRLEPYGVKLSDIEKSLDLFARSLPVETEKAAGRDLLSSKNLLEGVTNQEITARGGALRIQLQYIVAPQIVELGRSFAYQNGHRVVALEIYQTVGAKTAKCSSDVHNLISEFRQHLPEGIELTLAMDFGPNLQGISPSPGYFLIDLPRMKDCTEERIVQDRIAYESNARSVKGVEDVLILSQHPWGPPRDRPCMIVRCTASIDHETLIGQLRNKLKSVVPDIGVRLRDLTSGPFPSLNWQLSVAVAGPKGATYESIFYEAKNVGDLLSTISGLAELAIGGGPESQDGLMVEFDEAAVQAKNVAWEDAFDVLEQHVLKGIYPDYVLMPATDNAFEFRRFKGPWPVPGTGTAGARHALLAKTLRGASVKSANGSIVALAELIRAQKRSGPEIIDRIDGQPIVEITCTLKSGASLRATRRECEVFGGYLKLTPGYRLIWTHR
jgi:multidrug efflux pump subunit AcrB